MFFRDIIGQTQIKKRLINGVSEGRIAHAQLFCGNAGVGCLPTALAYAQYICCENRSQEDACGVCPACLKNAKLFHPDVHFVFPIINVEKSSDKTSTCDDYLPNFRAALLENPYLDFEDWYSVIKKENTVPIIYTREGEEVVKKLNLKSFEADYKIMIIWCAEKMHEAFANKVLKILEEPMGQTVFILISDQPEKLLTTIRSRTQQTEFPPIANEFLHKELIKRGLDSEDSDFYIKNSMGSWSKLLKNINRNETQQYYFELFVRMMRNCWNLKKSFIELQIILKELADLSRSSQIAFLQNAQREIRESYIYRLKNNDLSYMNKAEQDFAENFCKIITENNVEALMNEFAIAAAHIEQNVNSKFVFFDLMLIINRLYLVVSSQY
ncbi:MAG: DNA polymerase III subunit delta [Prevotellaceae bacterium]|jgi:DNA polymerase-3 subunit delta'|nr:DNA polymerase III subunit delta [Prevotellaceae bacterium]